MSSTPGILGVTRRGFLLGAAAGLAAGVPASYLAGRYLPPVLDKAGELFATPPPETPAVEYAMPGRYPGRVVEVHHPHAVNPQHAIDQQIVGDMVDRGMAEFVGGEPRDVRGNWGRFFSSDEVVGIKVNPVGRKPKRGEPGRVHGAIGSISNFELLIKVVQCLKEVGLPAKNIVVFERYAEEFADAGYADLMRTRPLDGVRWAASAVRYDPLQVDVSGFDTGRDSCSIEMGQHVAGYDPDVFAYMGFCGPQHSKRDDRRFRSHLSLIATRMVDKIITLPVLKDHRSAGVTLALKNLSHGMNNNVARSHLSGIAHGSMVGSTHLAGPNQCNTFIPQAVAQSATRQKATLHILDGLIGVYEGGPGCWNKTWGTWRRNSLFFATDPVAMDHVGWKIIDEKRASMGWEPVGCMGLVPQTKARVTGSMLAPFGEADPLAAAALTLSSRHINDGWGTEKFNLRQPDHVILAGQLGLGVFDWEKIKYRVVEMKG